MAGSVDGERPVRKNETWETIKSIALFVGIFLAFRILLFQPFTIPSASMEPQLMIGDYVVVSKYSYGWSRHSIPFSPPLFHGRIMERAPRRGDVVVFKLPRDGKTDFVKRLIGLPGDRIQVVGGVLHINGRAVPRQFVGKEPVETEFGTMEFTRYRETLDDGKSYITYDRPDRDPHANYTGVYVVPEGHYFFMGDNREDSNDSRMSRAEGVGFVPAENLVGRAELVLLSWNPEASLFKPWTWFTEFRADRCFRRL
ncbi:MAG: signal peptidase I [Phenylobacterium sp.]